MLARSLLIRIVPTLGCIAGLTGILSGCGSTPTADSPTQIPTVPVETIEGDEIINYAKAIIAVEPRRKAAINDIQPIIKDEEIPNITCTEPDTITALPRNVQDIVVKYCNLAKKDIESTGLTIDRFNAITATAQADQDLQTEIGNELIRHQSER